MTDCEFMTIEIIDQGITIEILEDGNIIEILEEPTIIEIPRVGLQGPGINFTTDNVNPTVAPNSKGAFFYNTVNDQLFIGVGTSSVNDWRELMIGLPP